MADPLSLTASVFGIVGPTISAVWKFTTISLELKDVPETSKVFVRILNQVNNDIVHAHDCYKEIDPHRGVCGIQVKWAASVIRAAMQEVAQFGRLFEGVSEKFDSPEFIEKVWFVMRDYKCLIDKERSLRFAHSRLLTAIGTMHLMIFQLGSTTKLSPSTPPAGRIRRRASPVPPPYDDDDDIFNVWSGFLRVSTVL
ncbi:hypothetical protein F5Y04DRAFT_276737 [Hypomontagnella monticulosa]|nr:hypothetical protein F5Y04DRAFT_276737 [Hypomontagnella monticulosa]